jgi:DNA invertase Pin-like site-specific DNA recombinase
MIYGYARISTDGHYIDAHVHQLTNAGCTKDLAEFECDLIWMRTGEGCKQARARGVKMGRKPKLTPHQQREAIKRKDNAEAVREINIHHTTISWPSL